MEDLFSSPRDLVSSAHDHLEALSDMVLTALKDDDALEQFIETYPEAGQEVHKIRVTAAIPIRVRTLCFNVVTELRAALDHAVYASTVALAGSPDPGSTKFPFGDDLTALNGEMVRRCRDVPSEIKALLLGFQPYEAGNKTLWRLNKLRNVKDHRRLIVVVPHIRDIDINSNFARMPGAFTPLWDENGLSSTNNEFAVLCYPIDTPADYDLHFFLQIAFGDVKHLGGVAVLSFFVDAHAEVARVVGEIASETARILADRPD